MRLFRQLLTESLLLAAIGSIMGLILAWWTKDLVVALAPKTLPRFDAVRMDTPVLGFTVLVSLLTAGGVGLVPAIRATRFDLNSLLKSDAASTTAGPGRRRMGNLLVMVRSH
jgi:ABC-type antimicrobial peptide transport system permease subunit